METEDTKSEYTQDYLRQLNGLLNNAIQLRYDYLQLLDDQIDEGFTLQCHHYRSQSFILGLYAGGITFLPSILLYFIGMILHLHWYKELAYIFIIAGLSTYFVLRALSWSYSYRVRPCERIGEQAREMMQNFKNTNNMLAQELHGILSPTSSITLNAGAREFLEKCLVFGVQIHGKVLLTLDSLTDRYITLAELEQVYKHIQQGNDWLIKGDTVISDIICGY